MFNLQGLGQNTVKKYNGFVISYNPHTDLGEETALLLDGNFYILLGDHRDIYKNCKNSDEAKKVFDNSTAERSYWSD